MNATRRYLFCLALQALTLSPWYYHEGITVKDRLAIVKAVVLDMTEGATLL